MVVYKPIIEIAGTHRLCYVESGRAWFAPAEPNQVYGDDWNDAPYEHNAGPPYAIRNSAGNVTYDHDNDFRILAFDHENVLTPAQLVDGPNSWFSVEDINSGQAPWLTETSWNTSYYYRAQENPGAEVLSLSAGATMVEFMAFMAKIGAAVYAPIITVGD